MDKGALASTRGADNPRVVEPCKLGRGLLVLGSHLGDGGVVAEANVGRYFFDFPFPISLSTLQLNIQ